MPGSVAKDSGTQPRVMSWKKLLGIFELSQVVGHQIVIQEPKKLGELFSIQTRPQLNEGECPRTWPWLNPIKPSMSQHVWRDPPQERMEHYLN